MNKLGKRAVACKNFYWMQGMLSSSGRRVGVWIPGTVCGASEEELVWPDLDDPATLGCLLHLVREACAHEASVCANHRGEKLADILSALPIPEEP